MPRPPSRRAQATRLPMHRQVDLAWLVGFPLSQEQGAVTWMSLPWSGERTFTALRVERTHLRRATYAVNKLAGHEHPALTDSVAEHGRWLARVTRLLGWFKAAIHEGKTLPRSLFETENAFPRRAALQAYALSERHPDLVPLLHAVSYVLYLTPRRAGQALPWFEAHASPLGNLIRARPGAEGIATALALWHLEQDQGERRVRPLALLIGDARAFSLAGEGTASYLDRWVKVLRSSKKKSMWGKPPPRPVANLGSELQELLDWLVRQNRTVRRRSLELLAEILPEGLLDDWDRWWTAALPLLGRAERLLQAAPSRTKEQARRLAKQLETRKRRMPSPFHARAMFSDLRRACGDELGGLKTQVLATLKRLVRMKGQQTIRAAFLHHWLDMARWNPHPALKSLLREFHAFLAQHGDVPGLLGPWEDVIQAWEEVAPRRTWGLDDALLGDLSDRRRWPTFFETLAVCTAAMGGGLHTEDGLRILDLVEMTGSMERASTAFLLLAGRGLREAPLFAGILRCGLVLDVDGRRLDELVAILREVEKKDEHALDAAMAAAGYLQQASDVTLPGDLILEGESQGVIALGERLLLLRAMGVKVEPPAELPARETLDWAERYPQAFGPTLARLHAVAPDAKRIASRILGEHYRDPEGIKQEIATLEALVAGALDPSKLRRRVENLQARLGSAPRLSPPRTTYLIHKLERATRRAMLHRWLGRLEESLQGQLRELLELNVIPMWLLQPRQIAVLASLLRLDPPFRALGIRLLRLRCGPPPWDLRDHPSNLAFLSRLRELGVDPQPWLNPQSHKWTGENGRGVHLAFEHDPLEIFQMGWHFDTCLSPHAFNFFSVLSVAADINKHVVYARDEREQVIGRCLLALSGEGGLITFEPYCHDPGLGFGAMISRLVQELAQEMHTTVLPRGNVPCLVAPDWYDDGPRDLARRFPFLESNSDYRRMLRTIGTEDLTAALEAAFHPLPLNALTLTLVLELPEFQDRPELILPLLPRIESLKGLSASTWTLAARLAYQAGALSFARQTIRRRTVPYVLAMTRRFGHFDFEAMRLIAALEPSLALRLLRRTRPRGVRSDLEEEHPFRRELLWRAHQALGRSDLAERLRASPK